MKNILLCLISLLVAALAVGYPTSDQVHDVWESDPKIIVAMVQKLYVVENAVPVLEMPNLMIVELDDGSTRVEYSGIMGLFIGTEEHNLSYAITLKPNNVVIGYTPQPRFPWEWLVIGGIALVGGGFVAGVLATR